MPFAADPRLPPDWRTSENTGEWEVMEQAALKTGRPVFCGLIDGDLRHRLIDPGSVPSEIIVNVMQVGGDDVTDVVSMLRQVERCVPLWIYFADTHGLKARFLRPIDSRLAHQIEVFLNTGTEGYLSDPGFTGHPGEIAVRLESEQGLRLWWD